MTLDYHNVSGAKPDYRYAYTYNDAGNVVRWEREVAGESAWDGVWTYAYDDHENLLAIEVDLLGDGTPDERWAYTYDDDGLLLQCDYDDILEDDADYRNDYRQTYTRDVAGNLLIYEADTGSDGSAERRETWTYDASGNVLRYRYDGSSGAWGATYSYDADGNLLAYASDIDGDGVADWGVEYTYDADGNMLGYEGWDAGVTTRVEWFTYDARGNQLTREADSGADGTLDERWTSSYNAANNLLSVDDDFYADGVVDQRSTYAYDTAGNLLLHESDGGWDGQAYPVADGIADYRESFAYDADNNLLTYEQDWYADGSPDYRELSTWDTEGRVLSEVNDVSADGGAKHPRQVWEGRGDQAVCGRPHRHGRRRGPQRNPVARSRESDRGLVQACRLPRGHLLRRARRARSRRCDGRQRGRGEEPAGGLHTGRHGSRPRGRRELELPPLIRPARRSRHPRTAYRRAAQRPRRRAPRRREAPCHPRIRARPSQRIRGGFRGATAGSVANRSPCCERPPRSLRLCSVHALQR